MGIDLVTPTAPFEQLDVVGDSISINIAGKILVLPTGNTDLLPGHNEFTKDPRIATYSELPLGGLKSSIPDYAPGTVNIISSDDVYLTDLSGTNSAKTFGAGKLKELGLLSFDTEMHAFTTEFQVVNNGNNNPTVIDNCDSTTGWYLSYGTGTISVENGKLKVVGITDTNGNLLITKSFSFNASSYNFFCFQMQASLSGYMYLDLINDVNVKGWGGARFSHSTNATNFVLPLDAPAGTTGQLCGYITGTFNKNSITRIVIGTQTTANTEVTFYIDAITADVGKWATFEMMCPDNLDMQTYSASGTKPHVLMYCWNGSYYESSVFPPNETDTFYVHGQNTRFLDGTCIKDVYDSSAVSTSMAGIYASGNKGSICPIISSTGVSTPTSLTYSSNYGTKKRIGFSILMPPSDGGRTNFNKIRLKVVTYYTTGSNGKRSVTYEFSNDSSASTGLQNIVKPFIVLFDPAKSIADFYLFTHKPRNLEFCRDETGQIYEIILYPGNGVIYHGQITYPDLTLDSDSNYIPNFLEAEIEGSITKFLKYYGMVTQ